jgi:hypothetical protein
MGGVITKKNSPPKKNWKINFFVAKKLQKIVKNLRRI